MQIHNNESQEAFEDSGYSSKISDKSAVLYELSLSLHTSLSVLSIESSSRSQEGSGGQKITPELLNKAFSAKATRLKS